MALLTTVIPGSWLIDQNVQENLELFHSGYPVIDHKASSISGSEFAQILKMSFTLPFMHAHGFS